MTTTAAKLAQHYQDRGLPWRQPDCPPDLRLMAEGLLFRASTEAVANRWPAVFAGITTARDWLALDPDEARRRLVPLGAADQRSVVMRRIAKFLTGDGDLLPGRYVDAVVSIRTGGGARPIVDGAISRIAAALGVEAQPWIEGLVADAVDPGVVLSVIQDIGRRHCRTTRACGGCPLAASCPSARSGLRLVKSPRWPKGVDECRCCGVDAAKAAYGARRLCSTCISAARRDGTLDRWPEIHGAADPVVRLAHHLGATFTAESLGVRYSLVRTWVESDRSPAEHHGRAMDLIRMSRRVNRARKGGEVVEMFEEKRKAVTW